MAASCRLSFLAYWATESAVGFLPRSSALTSSMRRWSATVISFSGHHGHRRLQEQSMRRL